jgi:putative ABC transport system permease protein
VAPTLVNTVAFATDGGQQKRRTTRIPIGPWRFAITKTTNDTIMLETTWHDLRYAVRGLRRTPGFATASLASLTIGIGASIAIFTVTDNVLVRPLPYHDPSHVVMIWAANRQLGQEHSPVSLANYLEWRLQASGFESVAAFRQVPSVLTVGGRVEELSKQLVTAELLPMLGVSPIRGRLFTATEDRPASETVLLISYRLWQEWFGGDESVIGRRVQVNATPRTIVGVLPRGFYFRDRAVDLWEPIGLTPSKDVQRMQARALLCVARIRRGATLEQARAHLSALGSRPESAVAATDKEWTVNVEPLQESLTRDIKAPLLILLAAVGLLLIVACANLAGLLLARHAARHSEMSVRTALGAGRQRVIRLLLTESVVIALTASAIGLLLARWLVQGFVALAPVSIVHGLPVSIDWRIVGVAVGLSFASAVMCGVVPALIATGRTLVPALRQDGRTTTTGHSRFRSRLVSAEVALTLILVTGAVLLFRSFLGLQAVEPGIAASNVLTFRVFIPAARYQELPRRTQFFARAIADIERLPGVRAASAISHLPFIGSAPQARVRIDGALPASSGEGAPATMRTVMPGYFGTMGIPIRDGRDFGPSDNSAGAPQRFIVNQEFVRRYVAGERAVGKVIRVHVADGSGGEIIGVVGDVVEGSLNSQPAPTLYQIHQPLGYTTMIFVVRSDGHPLALVEPIRRLVIRLDPSVPVSSVRTMEQILGETYARQRFAALLLSSFAAAALLLAAVGIYGVVEYSVSQRTHEIGVRVALGAGRAAIVRLILGAVVRMVAWGLAAGVVGAASVSGLLEKLLFGISPHDVTTFVVVPVLLAMVALLASSVPLFRAVRIMPTRALRQD